MSHKSEERGLSVQSIFAVFKPMNLKFIATWCVGFHELQTDVIDSVLRANSHFCPARGIAASISPIACKVFLFNLLVVTCRKNCHKLLVAHVSLLQLFLSADSMTLA